MATTRYWFRAKRVGWGWGLPTAWQGWVALGVFLALVVLGALALPASALPVVYVAYVGVLTAGLVGVCWLKGERPGRRG